MGIQAMMTKTTQDQRDLIRFAVQHHMRAFITHLRHVADDHSRVARESDHEIMRRIARKLHAQVEIAIDRVQDGELAPLFKARIQAEACTGAARAVLRRARK